MLSPYLYVLIIKTYNIMHSLKKFKNSVRLGGINYYSSAYLMNLKKSFDNAQFVKIGNQVFYNVNINQ